MKARMLRTASVVMIGALMLSIFVVAGADARTAKPAYGEFNPDHETVDLFDAMKRGDIGVKFIPKDSSEATIFVENKTEKPLNIRMPEAVGAEPILKQMGGGGMGGGMGGGGGQGMGGGGGGGMMNVPPEKVGRHAIIGVCLEHGKPEPRPAMNYQIKPIEEVTDRPEVQELCKVIGTGQVNQRAAQVAAWHLNNDMSIQELASKQLRYADGRRASYFSPAEIQGGMQLVGYVKNKAAQSGDSDKSLSEQ